MTTTEKNLTERINNFDFYYDYSENRRTWDRGNTEYKSIKTELDNLSPEQISLLKATLTVEERHLNFKFKKYFETVVATKEAIDRSFIMKMAWKLFRGGYFNSFADSLTASWKRFKLVGKLRKGQSSFTFVKANGDTRHAVGTLKLNDNVIIVNKDVALENPQLVKYFDLEKSGWRAFRLDRLIAA